MSSPEFYNILAQYKFVLAMENAVCDDYVTEKLWRSFYVGSVPIVYGSSRIQDILPDTQTAIEVLKFDSPYKLAAYLHELNANDTEYDKYLRYKRPNGVKNQVLLEMMNSRLWGINNDRTRMSHIDAFECLVCKRLNENQERTKLGKETIKYHATREHYGCPLPYTFSDKGVLLDESKRGAGDWKESTFAFSYQFAKLQLDVLFEDYLPDKIYNFTSKMIKDAAIGRHYASQMKNQKYPVKP
jgi:alpha-1,3-fucosyltransferase 10